MTLSPLIGRTSVLAFALLTLVPTVQGLEWKTRTVEVSTQPFQKTQIVTFDFANRGAKAVAIETIETSCYCVNATADAKSYAPGAAGTVTAEFTIGDRGGLFERSVTVITNEADSPIRLTLRVTVPDVAEMAPRYLSWHLQEATEEKFTELRTAAGVEMVFAETDVTDDAFTARLQEVEPGKLYRLFVRPRSTAAIASAAVRVSGHDKAGHKVVISAYPSIQYSLNDKAQ